MLAPPSAPRDQEDFPEVTDTTVEEWRPAHADLPWANVTGPEFYMIDWEDRGIVPRGLDAATLRGHSLAVPAIAERVWSERRPDLESRPGRLMALFLCAKVTGPQAHPEDPRLEPARKEGPVLRGVRGTRRQSGPKAGMRGWSGPPPSSHGQPGANLLIQPRLNRSLSWVLTSS